MENIMRVLETLKLEQEIGLDYTHQLEVSTNINFDDKEMYVASMKVLVVDTKCKLKQSAVH